MDDYNENLEEPLLNDEENRVDETSAPTDVTVMIASAGTVHDGVSDDAVSTVDETVVIASAGTVHDGVSAEDSEVSEAPEAGKARAADRYRVRAAAEGEDAPQSLEQRSLEQRSRYSGNYSTPRGARKAAASEDADANAAAQQALHTLDVEVEDPAAWPNEDDARYASYDETQLMGAVAVSNDDDPERTGDVDVVALTTPALLDSPPQPEQEKAAKRKSHRNKALIGVAIAVAAFALGVFTYAAVFTMNVTVNGQQHRVLKEDTIEDLINAGYASPKPGNLIAVDGSIALEGGGTPFTATVNGGDETSNPVTELTPDAVVVIWDGVDLPEEYTETTEPVPYPTAGDTVTASDYYAGAIHVYTPGVDGQQLVRTGDVSGKQVFTVTVEPVPAGYVAYNVDTHGARVVALTFDDGPSEYTPQVLDVLAANDAHATFFTVGSRVSSNADVVRRTVEMGNQVASHSWDHADGSGGGVNLTYMTAEEQESEVREGFAAIDQALGFTVSRIFRAPGGNYYGSLVDVVGPLIVAEVGWNIDTRDWEQPGVDAIVEQLMNVQPGDVVLMHDGGGDRSQTVEALSVALPRLRELGYDFVTIDQLLSMG